MPKVYHSERSFIGVTSQTACTSQLNRPEDWLNRRISRILVSHDSQEPFQALNYGFGVLNVKRTRDGWIQQDRERFKPINLINWRTMAITTGQEKPQPVSELSIYRGILK